MRFLTTLLVAGAAVLAASADEMKKDRWYFSVGAGADNLPVMEQNGRNRDIALYPHRDFSNLPDGKPKGYRWLYDLETDPGYLVQAVVGRMFKSGGRLELRYSRRSASLEQNFNSISYLYGETIQYKDIDIQSNSQSSVGGLETDTLALNVYYGVPVAGGKITPYLGGGIGLSFVKIRDLYYESNFTGTQPPDAPPLETFNGLQDADLNGTAPTQILSAGVDYRLTNETLIGLKWTYAVVDDIEKEAYYQKHPIIGLTNITRFSGMNHWSIGIEVKYLLGE